MATFSFYFLLPIFAMLATLAVFYVVRKLLAAEKKNYPQDELKKKRQKKY